MDGSLAPPPQDPDYRQLAVQLGRFRVLEEIARGGTGAVFRALDQEHGRPVALKLQLSGTERQRRRLLREAQVLTRLSHPHVVRAEGAGEVHGHVWLAMELVTGVTLEQEVTQRGPLAPVRAVGLALKLALGLAHAHAQGVWHRDVKPSNVVLDPRGEPRLIDFGLALDLNAATRLSQEGAIMGTPGYWAPELATGNLGELGPATDVYGLGATLYYALTGQPPTGGHTVAEIVHATLRAAPSPPSRRNGAVPAELDALVLRCLAKDPGQRWGSMAALADALQGWLSHPAGRASSARRREPLRLLLAGGLVGLGALAALAIVRARRGDGAPPAALPPPTAVAPDAPAPAESPAAPVPPLPAPPEVGAGAGPVLTAAQAQARTLDLRARDLIDAGAHAEALPLVQRVLELDPTLAQAWLSLGLCRDALGDPAGAEEAFRSCLRLEPRNAKGWSNLGAMHRRSGRLAEAREDYARALEADPGYAQAWANRGVLRREEGDLIGSLADFARAVELDPQAARFRAGRALTREGLGDLAGARADYDAALALRDDPALRAERGWLLERQGLRVEALQDYTRALEQAPRDRRILLLRAHAREDQGDLAGSLEDLERALPLTRDHPRLQAEVEAAIDRLRAQLGR